MFSGWASIEITEMAGSGWTEWAKSLKMIKRFDLVSWTGLLIERLFNVFLFFLQSSEPGQSQARWFLSPCWTRQRTFRYPAFNFDRPGIAQVLRRGHNFGLLWFWTCRELLAVSKVPWLTILYPDHKAGASKYYLWKKWFWLKERGSAKTFLM